MPTYVTLLTLTDRAIKDIRSAPKRIDEAVKRLEKLGGKLLGFYATLGDFDYVIVSHAPNDKIALTFLLGLGQTADLRTKTLKAYSRDQYESIIKELK